MPNACAIILPVPRADPCLRVFCGFLNIIIPGLGLFILSLCYQKYGPKYNPNYGWVALAQFLLGFIGIGWIWSIINGFVMMFVGCIYGDHEFGNAEEVVDYEDEEKRHPRNAPNVKDQDNENQRNKVIT